VKRFVALGSFHNQFQLQLSLPLFPRARVLHNTLVRRVEEAVGALVQRDELDGVEEAVDALLQRGELVAHDKLEDRVLSLLGRIAAWAAPVRFGEPGRVLEDL